MDATKNEHVEVSAPSVGAYVFYPAREGDKPPGFFAIPGQEKQVYRLGGRSIIKYQQKYVTLEWIRAFAKKKRTPVQWIEAPQWR